MYTQASRQELQQKDFFYPKETMGTTIMAIKYDKGVIACADSSNLTLTQEPPQVESTWSTEWQIRSTTSTSTSWCCEADWQGSRSRPHTKYGT